MDQTPPRLPPRRNSNGYFALAGIALLIGLIGSVAALLLIPNPNQAADPATLTGSYVSPEGFTIRLPAGWVMSPVEDASLIDSDFALTVAAQSRQTISDAFAGLDSLNVKLNAPVVIAMVGPLDEVPAPLRSSGLIHDLLINERPEIIQETVKFGARGSLTVGGYDTAKSDFDGRSADGAARFQGRLMTVVWGDKGGFFVGVAPDDQWEQFRPIFNAMIASLELR